MKLALWIFALFLAISGIIVIAFFVDEVPLSHGQQHDTYKTMSRGGDGARNDNIVWLGTTLGILLLTLFVSMLALALHLNKKQCIVIGIGATLMQICFLAMVFSYRSILAAEKLSDPPIFLGLPVPTAFMIYGLGLSPLFFVLFYVVQFDSCVLKLDRYEKFKQILAEQQGTRAVEDNH